MLRILASLTTFICAVTGVALPAPAPASVPQPLVQHDDGRHVSLALYQSLEELARLVDISYCVGTTGISQPFECYNHCSNFAGFELVTTWNTGIFLSDSCGYIAVSHEPFEKRIIVAFRGTYSIANTIVDLSTNPAEYVPFLGDDNDKHTQCGAQGAKSMEPVPSQLLLQQDSSKTKRSVHDLETCTNCTVHSGFLGAWRNTRCAIIPHVERALKEHPGYKLTLVGHSLGGAVAALAGLEFQALGWNPQVTTFGEPRIGNKAFNEFLDRRFHLDDRASDVDLSYRRVTHVNDPVPLLPLEEWGYTMHAGEIFVSRASLPPNRDDVTVCQGDADPQCITGTSDDDGGSWGIIPKRYQLWELMFAHRDYFWRLGLCVPGGDLWDWWRVPTNETDSNE